jgi:hypothetical protein
MFRKTTLALAAAATLAVTAAIPTTASAHWTGWRHHHRSHTVVRVYSPGYAYAPRPYYAYAQSCFVKKRLVHTHWGWRVKRIRVCR